MRIISWNVNGLRANYKKGAFGWLLRESPDIFCLQEVKADIEQLPNEVHSPAGYHAFFASSKTKKGYSGVALYTKQKPDKVEHGLGISRFDDEGRVLIAQFKDLVVLNVYFPNGGGGPERLAYKLDFYDAFLDTVGDLRKHGKGIVFCGDVNTAHEAIDLARPKENEKNTGFLPEERAWLDEVESSGFVDTFRHFHPHKKDAYTYWDMKTRARDRNVGWRIDYFFVSPDLTRALKKSDIHMDVLGSDHCPISIELNIKSKT